MRHTVEHAQPGGCKYQGGAENSLPQHKGKGSGGSQGETSLWQWETKGKSDRLYGRHRASQPRSRSPDHVRPKFKGATSHPNNEHKQQHGPRKGRDDWARHSDRDRSPGPQEIGGNLSAKAKNWLPYDVFNINAGRIQTEQTANRKRPIPEGLVMEGEQAITDAEKFKKNETLR